MVDNVTISREEYETMQLCVNVLDALREAGVENWEGFQEAIRPIIEVSPLLD